MQGDAVFFWHHRQTALGHQADGAACRHRQLAAFAFGIPELNLGVALLQLGALHQQITGVVGAEAGEHHRLPLQGALVDQSQIGGQPQPLHLFFQWVGGGDQSCPRAIAEWQ